ncbi:MAG TPA: energy transducer TonB [Elusimicrobiota bacterium]|jgi:TonB family protein|nr:energy transducer TonB [Elusimicrobiota bacterium]
MIAQERERPIFRARERRKSYLPLAFALSFGAHGLVYLLGYAAPRPAHQPVELDLTMSGHLGRLGGGRAAPPPPPSKPAAWVKAAPNKAAPLPDLKKDAAAPPAPETAPAPAPAPAADRPPAEYGEGEGDMTSLTRLPQLKNLGDLRAILRRFYPEAERLSGKTGTVVIDLHVDIDGRVVSVDVARSATPAFDEAARKVGLLLRFTPAYLGTQRVAVKLRQAIQFNLSGY